MLMRYLAYTIFYFLILQVSCTEKNIDSKPNVLFIFADDMSYEAVGGTGHPLIKTPHIDRLMKNGTTYTHAYNMGGWHGAICVASRSMLISGRSIWRAREMEKKWRDNDSLSLKQTWPRLMESAGYNTYMTGKWHVQAKAKDIFQKAVNIRPGMPGHLFDWPKVNAYMKESGYDPETWADVMPPGYNRPQGPDDQSWSPSDSSFGGFWEGGIHWSEVVANDALSFIEDTKNSDDPFFMYLAFNAPHDHRQASEKYINMYPLDNIELPANWLPMYPFKDSIGCKPSLRDEALAPFPRTPLAIKTHLQEYYAIITHMDAQIGRIYNALEKSGKAENTYIIFTADHGLSVSHHGLLGKQNMYDHSVRVPFVISGPDIPKGRTSESEIYLQDAMATALDIADIDKPSYVEFRSVLNDAKSNENKSHREDIIGIYEHNQRMIRKDHFKLIVYPRVPKLRLFNLSDDPLEMNDLSTDESYYDLMNDLFEQLKLRQSELADPFPLSDFKKYGFVTTALIKKIAQSEKQLLIPVFFNRAKICFSHF